MSINNQQLKFVFIGAGSSVFTLKLIGDLLLEKTIMNATLTLVDIDEVVLNEVTIAAENMIRAVDSKFEVEKYTRYEDALYNADFVFFTFAVGGINSWKKDIKICTKYGINQSVGDTIGPGGIIRILRTIPLVLDIAAEMEKKCPYAWIINYANPEGAVCLALYKYTKIKAFGLCHGTPDTAKDLAKLFEVDAGRLKYRAAGLNHLTWFTELRIDGKDVYGDLLKQIESKGWDKEQPISTSLYKTYGLYPAPGDRHVGEFFPFFMKDRVLKEQDYTWKNNDFVVVDSWREEARKKFESLLIENEGHAYFLKGSGETAFHFIRALLGGEVAKEMVNVINDGYIDNISKGVIVELPTFVDSFGLHPEKIGNLPHGIAAKCETLGREYLLAVEAAVAGDYHLALQALILDPLVANCDYPDRLLDDLINENKVYLPKFMK